MNGQAVHLSATFVSTKPGTNPSISIESLINLTHHIGTVGSKDFQEMKERIKNLVEDERAALYFHQDDKNVYRFSESSLPNGAIYGLRESS